ncbi:MAG: 50S ribosomal protein L23, partial [Chthoniobacterales bacterium]
MNDYFDIIETASLTEKASLMSEKLNKYVFRVSPRANKIQIKQAIEKLF